MADHSFQWAKTRNLLRVNDVHKCEEAKLIIEETFSLESEHGQKTSMVGSGDVEE